MKICIHPLAACLLLLALLFVNNIRMSAQETTASIHGTVTDPTGAVLQNATVTVVNTSTGISITQRSDSKGYFLFPDLHIGGPYTLTVDETRFLRFVSTGIMLDLSSAREINAKLQVGASSQSVRVDSAAVQVETADVQLKNLIGAAEIVDLPTLGAMPSSFRRLRLGSSNPPTAWARSLPTGARPKRTLTCWMARTSTTSCSTSLALHPIPTRWRKLTSSRARSIRNSAAIPALSSMRP